MILIIFDKHKSKICSHVVLQSERPGNRLFSVGNNWIQRRKHRTVKQVVDSYQQVTCADAADVLLSESFISSDFQFPGATLSFDVDVTGVPDEEIVVFVGQSQERSGQDVPASSEWGLFVLAAAILVAGYYLVGERTSNA